MAPFCNPHGAHTLQAVDLLAQCVTTVAREAKEDEEREEKLWVEGWFPLLFGLHRVMTRCQLDVRTRALTVLIEAIKQYGKAFKRENWQDLFRITFRIFDDLKLPENPQEVRVRACKQANSSGRASAQCLSLLAAKR